MRRLGLVCLSLVLGVGVLATGAPVRAQEETTRRLPDDWYPESLAAGPDGALYVGSWRQGAVSRLPPQAGAPALLVAPGSNGLANTQGVLVDAAAGLLWVCSSAAGFTTVPQTPSALKSYDLSSGSPRGSYAMPDAGYCNDLAQTPDGTLLVTDSLNPRILALGRGDPALRIWLEDGQFAAGDDGYAVNGIAVDPAGVVYVSPVTAVPYILRIGIDGNGQPGKVERVAAPRTLRNVDAVRFLDARHLVLVESDVFGETGARRGTVLLATLDQDSISRLQTLAGQLDDPSSGIILGDRVWYVQSRFGLLTRSAKEGVATPQNVPFSVESVLLPGSEPH